MCSELVIRLDEVWKSFPVYARPHHRLLQLIAPRWAGRLRKEFHALKGVSLMIPRGQTVGIVGRNGSGKSTLLQIICGTLDASKGSVAVQGRIAALLELGAGFNPEFTGRENVFLSAAVQGMDAKEVNEKFDDILAFADIGEFIDQPVKTYSSGMYVRLAFSVAIHVEPDLLVVDEALAVGDEAFQRKCFARIEAIRKSGSTVLFVSHSAGTVLELCDRAVLLDGGELLADGAPRDVVALYQKMLYAADDAVSAIKERIREWESGDSTELAVAGMSECQSEGDAIDWFDPALVPESTISYDSRGARVSEPALLSGDGRQVNVLVHGAEYKYQYRVKFERAAGRVRFGMMIKTVTGIEVCGSASAAPTQSSLTSVAAGDEAVVEFKFACRLAPGVYFLNAGVLCLEGEEEIYMDRHIDIAMFRVQDYVGRRGTGLADLVDNARVTLIAVEAEASA